ncbi:MAG: winged helix-turn-helix domain-containing protein [Proteobacteria bacterium]|nr:winged helix-turn-helix domain-containing protein [Pseudomonadota bacterium]
MSGSGPAPPSPAIVHIAGFVIDLAREELRTATGVRVELRPRSFAVLRLLAVNPERLVTKDEIMASVWDDAIVTEDSLTQSIADIRRALGDADRRLIRTVPRRGYMLDGATAAPSDPPRPPAPARSPTWRVTAIGAALAALLVLLAVFSPSPVQTRWEMPPKTPDRPSLAVLAFKPGIPGPQNELVAIGLATEIINELARNRDLKVIARDSSFALSGRGLSPRTLGEQLHVRYLVDGTVQRVDDRLSVAVQLIDTRDNTIAWADEISATAADIGTLQPKVASRIATTLHSGMRETEKHAALAHPLHDLDVHALTLRGLALKHQFNAQATREGRQALQEAIARDPAYAPAWAYLGWLNITDILNQFTGEWSMARIHEVIAQFNKAIELDPNLPVAYQGLSRTVTFTGNLDEALRLIRRAVELGPGDADNLLFLGTVLHQKGDAAGAVQAAEAAIELNPVRPAYYGRHYAEILWGAGRYQASLDQAEDCLWKAPKFTHCEIFRILDLVALRRLPEASAAWQSAVGRMPHFEQVVQSIVPVPEGLAARYVTDLRAAGWASGTTAVSRANARRP